MVLSHEDRSEKVKEFLKRMRPLLATTDYTIEQNCKNKNFDEKYPINSSEKTKILKSLTVDDCIKIDNNKNTQYADAELYFFIKDVSICCYGEDENICLYLKIYIRKNSYYDMIIIISFHEEGTYE